MNSSRPYLIRAIYEWLVDNEKTPYVMVDATVPGVRVPEQFIEDGKIILNLQPFAIAHLNMGNEVIEFDARFSGVAHHLYIPIESVKAIYAFENGRGMVFGDEDEEGDGSMGEEFEFSELAEEEGDDTPPPRDDPPKGKKRPSLKIVK